LEKSLRLEAGFQDGRLVIVLVVDGMEDMMVTYLP
jgi:hypothetical protein